HAFTLHYFTQRRHHRRRRFLFHQLRVIDLARGVVQYHDQVVPTLVLKPLVTTAVDMQQHARQWPPWAPLAVHPPLAPPRYQPPPPPLPPTRKPPGFGVPPPPFSQRALSFNRKSPPRTAPTPPPPPRHGPPLRRCPPSPPVKQRAKSPLLVPLPPAPHVPVAD